MKVNSLELLTEAARLNGRNEAFQEAAAICERHKTTCPYGEDPEGCINGIAIEILDQIKPKGR